MINQGSRGTRHPDETIVRLCVYDDFGLLHGSQSCSKLIRNQHPSHSLDIQRPGMELQVVMVTASCET